MITGSGPVPLTSFGGAGAGGGVTTYGKADLLAIDLAEWDTEADYGGDYPGPLSLPYTQDPDTKVVTFAGNLSDAKAFGLLRPLAAGDFRVGMRIGWRPGSANPTAATTGQFSATMVDGQDLTLHTCYGAGWLGSAIAYNSYVTSVISGTWNGAVAGTTLTGDRSTLDVVLERVGTTLTTYVAGIGEALVKLTSATIGVGAPLVGPRGKNTGSGSIHLLQFYGYRELASMPTALGDVVAAA